jgi:autotransporter passenger strand-loop-strand repeat protein
LTAPYFAKRGAITMGITFIGSGVTSSGLTISNGDELLIGSGAKTSNTRVLAGGSEDPEPDGIAINVNVYAGGYLIGKGVVGGNSNIDGTINGVTLVQSGAGPDEYAIDRVFSGGRSINVTIDDQAELILSAGAVATGGVVSSGGVELVSGASLSGATVSKGGLIDLINATSLVDDVILSGASGYGWDDGPAGVFVSDGGTFTYAGDIFSGQTVIYTTSIAATTALEGVTLSSGSILYIAVSEVLDGGTLSLTSTDAVAAVADIAQGGTLLGPGRVDGVILDSGAVDAVRLVSSATIMTVENGGTASGDAIGSGAEELIERNGVATSETIISGGSQVITNSGSIPGNSGEALDTIVSGRQFVNISGFASGSIIRDAGSAVIANRGSAAGTLVSNGYEEVNGSTTDSVISSGGHEMVGSHGVESGSVISNGGTEVVQFNGITEAPTVLSGGELRISSTGSAVDGLTIAGGTATIAGWMSAGQTVRFTGTAGVLAIDNLASFGAQISGLLHSGQRIDLGGFAYSAGEKVTWIQTGTSGTLMVSGSAQVATLTLDGAYTSGDFALSTDNSGGTYIDDPRPTAGFAQAIAGFSGRAEGIAAVHAGGTALASIALATTAGSSGR